jgi:hypothetical protein
MGFWRTRPPVTIYVYVAITSTTGLSSILGVVPNPTGTEARFVRRRKSSLAEQAISNPSRSPGFGDIGSQGASSTSSRAFQKRGKQQIALSYAAIVSSGGKWPDGTRATVGSVLIWTAEDDADDTLVPRLMRMGADLDRIHFIEEAIPAGAKSRPFNPATDMPALVEKAKAIGDVALLLLDPVVAAVPMTRNSHNNAESRNGMQPVIDFAKASDIAVLGIGHLTKGTVGKDPLERINGSGRLARCLALSWAPRRMKPRATTNPNASWCASKGAVGRRKAASGWYWWALP